MLWVIWIIALIPTFRFTWEIQWATRKFPTCSVENVACRMEKQRHRIGAPVPRYVIALRTDDGLDQVFKGGEY